MPRVVPVLQHLTFLDLSIPPSETEKKEGIGMSPIDDDIESERVFFRPETWKKTMVRLSISLGEQEESID